MQNSLDQNVKMHFLYWFNSSSSFHLGILSIFPFETDFNICKTCCSKGEKNGIKWVHSVKKEKSHATLDILLSFKLLFAQAVCRSKAMEHMEIEQSFRWSIMTLHTDV